MPANLHFPDVRSSRHRRRSMSISGFSGSHRTQPQKGNRMDAIQSEEQQAIVTAAISGISHIATLPEITLKIIELVEDPTSTAHDLHNVISNDQALCSPLIWFALWLLLRVGQDYRRAVYGRPSRQIDPEQLSQMRESLLDGDPITAIRIYRKAVPDAGREDAKRFVGRLALKVEAEDPKRYRANQPTLSEINWRAVGICLVIEAIVVLAIWSTMELPPLGLIATGLVGGLLYVVIMIARARSKKNSRRRLVIGLIGACGMMITIFAPVFFMESNASQLPFSWPWTAGFLGGVLPFVFAYSRRR